MNKPTPRTREDEFYGYIIYLLEQINNKLDKLIEPEVVVQETVNEVPKKKTRRKKE
jgi:hypothetical protein